MTHDEIKAMEKPLRDGDVIINSIDGIPDVVNGRMLSGWRIVQETECYRKECGSFNILDFAENFRQGLIPVWLTKDEVHAFLTGSKHSQNYYNLEHKIAAAMEGKP
jgi:hypothetical protein